MELRDYMHKHRLKAPALAKLIGCSKQHLAYIKSGKAPSKWLAMAIVMATQGEVTMEDLRPTQKEAV